LAGNQFSWRRSSVTSEMALAMMTLLAKRANAATWHPGGSTYRIR
jgi:hypothetical protein